jgi:hypothetical protein
VDCVEPDVAVDSVVSKYAFGSTHWAQYSSLPDGVGCRCMKPPCPVTLT